MCLLSCEIFLWFYNQSDTVYHDSKWLSSCVTDFIHLANLVYHHIQHSDKGVVYYQKIPLFVVNSLSLAFADLTKSAATIIGV